MIQILVAEDATTLDDISIGGIGLRQLADLTCYEGLDEVIPDTSLTKQQHGITLEDGTPLVCTLVRPMTSSVRFEQMFFTSPGEEFHIPTSSFWKSEDALEGSGLRLCQVIPETTGQVLAVLPSQKESLALFSVSVSY